MQFYYYYFERWSNRNVSANDTFKKKSETIVAIYFGYYK